MKIIYNNILPFKGFIAINLFGVLFVRKEWKNKLKEIDIRHESIHSKQCWELLGIFFYLWYVIEWFIRIFQYIDGKEAYRNISFEREAYFNEMNPNYLNERKHYNFIKYMYLK